MPNKQPLFDKKKIVSQRAIKGIVLVGLSCIVFVFLSISGQKLRNEYAPVGLVSFALSGDAEVVSKILHQWNTDLVLQIAKRDVLIDYIFIVLYVWSLSFLAGATAVRFGCQNRILYFIGLSIVCLILLAGVLDGFENYAVLQMLAGDIRQIWLLMARYCAIVKFIIVLFSLAYIVFAFVWYLRKNRNIKQNILT